MQRPFLIEAADDGAETRLRVTGELDIATVPELVATIRAQQLAGRAVRLDLSQLDFIDSTGIMATMQAVNDAKVNGWDLSVHAQLSEPVRRAFALTSLLPLLPVVED